MQITYRMAVDEDIDGLAEFWSNNSGWDIIDRLEWERRFVHTPAGRASVVVGFDEDTGNIIALFVFIPVDIVINGREEKAYRPFAPILEQSLQTKFGIASLLTGRHPLLKMYKIIWDELAAQGITLIYILPDPRWSRVLKAFPFIQTHKFPLWSRPLNATFAYSFPKEISISKISPADPSVDLLWQQAACVYNCSIARNSKSLPWKTSHGNYQVYAIWRHGEIAGLFVFIHKQRDHQWLICDMIAKDKADNLSVTLAAACTTIEKESNLIRNGNGISEKIAILATPSIEEAVKKMEFKKDNYHFTLAVHVLDKANFHKTEVAPINWYVSAND